VTLQRIGSDLQKKTASHYDQHPFEFLTPTDEGNIEGLQPAPFVRFVERHVRKESQVAEIGCGPGRGTMYLVPKSGSVVALDISEASLSLAGTRARGAGLVCGSALSLPFGDANFDVVVCDGVVHHTPSAQKAFQECARVLRSGGAFYLGVYNRSGYYFYVYTYVGPIVRALEASRFGHLLIISTLFPVYYLAHLVKSRGRRTLTGARNFFYDYIITPRASFHCREEVEAWAAEAGLELEEYDARLGNVHTFSFVKLPANLR